MLPLSSALSLPSDYLRRQDAAPLQPNTSISQDGGSDDYSVPAVEEDSLEYLHNRQSVPYRGVIDDRAQARRRQLTLVEEPFIAPAEHQMDRNLPGDGSKFLQDCRRCCDCDVAIGTQRVDSTRHGDSPSRYDRASSPPCGASGFSHSHQLVCPVTYGLYVEEPGPSRAAVCQGGQPADAHSDGDHNFGDWVLYQQNDMLMAPHGSASNSPESSHSGYSTSIQSLRTYSPEPEQKRDNLLEFSTARRPSPPPGPQPSRMSTPDLSDLEEDFLWA